MSANENFDLDVGNDPEVSFTRIVEALKFDDKKSEYNVIISIKNRKSRVINFEFIETFQNRFFVVPAEDNEFKIQVMVANNQIKVEGVIKANSEKSFKFFANFLDN